jgi:membrane-associated phospholipid phosphatase
MQELIESFKKFIPALFMALFGVLAGYALREGERWSLRSLVANVIFGTFAGVVVYLLLSDYPSIPPGLKWAGVGLSGYMAKEILGILSRRLLKTAQAIDKDKELTGVRKKK